MRLLRKIWDCITFILLLPLVPVIGIHTTIAFCQAAAVTTEEPIAGVADQHARVSGDDIFVGKYNRIVGMFGGGHSAQTIRIVSPSLRRFFCPYVHPYYSGAGDAAWLAAPVNKCLNPIPVETNEALNAMIVVSEVHATPRNFAGINLAEGRIERVYGDIRTIVIEASVTMTIGVWTNHSLTLPQDLPVGRYQVVGAMVRSNNVGIFRLVPVGADHRPGGMIDATSKVMDMLEQREGKMGVWCEFDQLTPPSLDVCMAIAGTWYSLKLDLIKVA